MNVCTLISESKVSKLGVRYEQGQYNGAKSKRDEAKDKKKVQQEEKNRLNTKTKRDTKTKHRKSAKLP